MALSEENDAVSKEGVRNVEWVKISMRKHVNTEIIKENKNLRAELKELTAITETWLNSSNKVNECTSEQIPSQKKIILGVDQLTKDTSSSGQKDLVFVKSLVDDTKVSIPGVERPWLFNAKGFILPNHDTGRILPAESQRNTTDPSVAVIDSSVTDYDSADKSSVCLEVGSIRRIQVLDTAYWGFLRVGTMLDIFQNIILIPYFQYGVLVFWIRRIELYSSVVFGECRHGYAVSSLMDTTYWSSE
ncbi:hypothetical protein Tco_1141258 [Tanacetum coccineum]